MHHGDPVAQPAGVLDLDGDVEEPVAVEVAELIGRVELRREGELTTQARRDQSAVGPASAQRGRPPKVVREIWAAAGVTPRRATASTDFTCISVIRLPAGLRYGVRSEAAWTC